MQPYDRYLIALSVTLTGGTTVLAAYGVQQLDAYLSLDAIVFLRVSATILTLTDVPQHARGITAMLERLQTAGYRAVALNRPNGLGNRLS